MMRAAAVLSKHPSAVLFDFTTKLHAQPHQMTRNQRSRLVVELMRDPTTRVAAIGNGWKYTPSDREIALWDQLEIDRIRATPMKERAALPPLRRPWWPDIDEQAQTARTWRPGARERLAKWVKRQNLGGSRDS